MARIGTEVRKNIAETQEMVLESLREKSQAAPSVRNQVLEAVLQCGNEDLGKLGTAGKCIKRFAEQVTLQHPEMGEVAKMKDWDVFSRDVFQALASSSSEETKTKLNVYKPILRHFTVPKSRFVADPLRRDTIRQEKKHARHVGLKQVYMLGENGFYGKPDDFKMYVRNSKAHLEEIAKLEVQQKVFTDHNMPEVSHTVKKRIKGMEEMREASYLGFHRLRPMDAAVIAGRMIGLRWHELHFLTVPFKFFESHYWPEVGEKRDEDKQKDEMKRLLVMKDRKMAMVDSTAFTFQPRLYPLAKFPEFPKSVGDVIATVESLPELNGCPAFDYYWVLVPSININHPYFRHKDGWKLYARRTDGTGWSDLELRSFQDEYEAALALDKTLVCDGYFPPIVLGEREGKCFFLSMWR